MEEQKSVSQSKEGIKDAMWAALNKAAIDLINSTINAKNLGKAIVVWCVLSFLSSILVVSTGRCDKPKMVSGKYFQSRLFCQVDQIVE